jgi:hypothetical protein
MHEEKIIIKIDENGELFIETKGILGPSCIDEVKKLLDEDAEIVSLNKTDEFYQGQELSAKTQSKIRRSLQ